MKKYFILFTLLLMLAGCKESNPKGETPEPAPEEIPDLKNELTGVMNRNNAVGLAVAAVKDGEIVYNCSLGYKDLENRIQLGDNDIMRIASISKTFTAVGVMQLIEQGKISLDDDVSQIMGFEIRNPKYPDTPITVRMLLSHTSSMSDSNGYYSLDKLHREKSSTWQKAWSNYEPGSKYQYCNLGFNTLGALIEKVSGERFDLYIENHILKPLGVYASHNVLALDESKFVKLYQYNSSNKSYTLSSSAYEPQTEALKNYTLGWDATVFSPTGGLKISAIDLAKVMMMHMNLGAYKDVKILDSASCEKMQSLITPTNYKNEYYGLGIITTDNLLENHTLTGHDGLALGAYTAMYWDKEKGHGFVVMTNGCNGETEYDFANILCESVECLYKNLFEEK